MAPEAVVVLATATRHLPLLGDLQDYHVLPKRLDGSELRVLPVDAGDVVFFHSLLIHGTGQNVGVFDRVADIISYMPAAARVAGAEPTDSPLACSHLSDS